MGAPAKKKTGSKKVVSIRDKMNQKEGKLEELKAFVSKVNNALGTAGAVYLGTEQRAFERIRSGVVALDYVLGGGLVRGQMVMFTGGDSSAKTTAAMISAGSVQAEGGTVVWVAGEGFDKRWSARLGVRLEDLIVITADTGDTAMEAAVTMVQQNLVDLLILDSVQSLGTTREMDSGVDDEAYAGAGAPQMWGRVMRKMYAAANAGARTATIAISQVRSPIGKYGSTEPEGSGVWALKHWKAAEVYFKKGELYYEGEATEKRKILGREFKLRCMKNKTAQPERHASFKLMYEKGGYPYIDNPGTTLRLAKALGLIKISGSWILGYGIKLAGHDKYDKLIATKPLKMDRMLEDVYKAMDQ